MGTTVTANATEGQVLTMRSGAPTWDVPGATATRAAQLIASRGLLSENYPLAVAGSSTAMVSGTIYLLALGVLNGDVLTNAHPCIGTGGSGLTLCKAGYYDKSGNRLAVSADLSTDWASTGIRTNAMSSPYNVTADGAVYLALLAVGTTPPSLLRGSNLSTIASVIGSNIRHVATGGTGQTDLGSTISVVGTAPIAFWCGAS